MLQLIYVSTASAGNVPDVDAILRTSRRNNACDGITGLLYFDGVRFLQALEGDDAKVEATFARIGADPRHFATVVLSRRTITKREFGAWAMAERKANADPDALLDQLTRVLAEASPNVKATFAGFAKLSRAA